MPVLRRPHRAAPLLRSIARATPFAHVVFIANPYDVPEHEAIIAARRNVAELEVTMMCDAGNYAHKINAAVRATTESLLFLGADDLEFHPGWFEAAVAYLDRAGVVGTNDLCNRRVMRGEHATHSLLTRDYANRGTVDDESVVLHPGYAHEFVDDEFVATARARGEFAFAADAVVEHLHPMVGKAPMDELYAAQGARMVQGRRLFAKRRHLWAE